MTVEAATYINTLNSSYPEGSSPANELDNHARLIKASLLASFPNVAGAVSADHTELSLLDGVSGSILSTGAPVAGQMVLMSSTTVSGSPSAIDFIHGTGGVVLSSAYEDYLITYSGISHASSSNAKLRLQASTNAGSTWAASVYSESLTAAGSTPTAAYSASAFEVTGGQANTTLLTSSSGMGLGGQIRLTRAVSAGTGTPTHMWLVSEFVGMETTELARGGIVFGRAYGAITGIRLLWDSGSFGNTGVVKLYGRKV